MPTNQPLGSLAQLLGEIRVPVENLVFKQKSVNLDGYIFKNCAFVGCVLITSKGNFQLEECFTGPGSVIYFTGDAQRVVRLASLLDLKNLDVNLQAQRNPDGSFTVK